MTGLSRDSARAPAASRPPVLLALSVALTALGLACRPAPPETRGQRAADFAAPPTIRATLVFEPPTLTIGEITVAELAVVTPPDYHLAPVAPVKLPGLWLLGVRALPLETEPGRWTHRTEFRVRPRDLGVHEWPAMTVHVDGPDGERSDLEVPPRTFEVTSVNDRFARRSEPFGLEAEPVRAKGWGFGQGLSAGLGIAVLVGICGLLLQRRSTARREATAADTRAARDRPPASLREWSERELARALEANQSDPHRAAAASAHLLRVYISRRFGGNALTATTEELGAQTPSLALRSVWPDFVRILRVLDDARFRPRTDTAAGAGGDPVRNRVRRALEDSGRLVSESLSDGATARGDAR